MRTAFPASAVAPPPRSRAATCRLWWITAALCMYAAAALGRHGARAATVTPTPTTSGGDSLLNALNTTTTTYEDEEREYMDRVQNTQLARLTLNTLTTSCNGGCGADSPCVVVGQSSENKINCVNDTRCATLLSGRAALCLEPYDRGQAVWGFYPAKRNDTPGISPFERVGLLQPPDTVSEVLFRRANDEFGPLTTSLDVSSLNLQPTNVIQTLTIDNLELTGVEDALPVNAVFEMNINNCHLKDFPIQLAIGTNIRFLDLSKNDMKSASKELKTVIFPNLLSLNLQENQLSSFDVTSETFPVLEKLYLDGNKFKSIPNFVFNLSSLTDLSVFLNPLNASKLTEDQFEFLASLQTFAINGTTPTEICPSDAVIAKLNESFTFCVDTVGSGSGSGNGSTIEKNEITLPPVTTVDNPPSTEASRSNTGLIVGIVIGVLALLGIGAFIVWWCRRRGRSNHHSEVHKPTFTSVGSFAGNAVEDLQDHHYQPYPALPSNESSEHSSDTYEVIGNISADGPDGLTRLSYQELLLRRLMRVSSRSELWLGEYLSEPVVIKKIKANTVSRAIMRDFVEEVKLMSGLRHPRIVEFKGALWDANGSELCAVVEYVEKGALRERTNGKLQLTVPKQHAIGRQIAEGLAFLHSQQIVHGRLNAFNILLDRDLSAKISLFSIFHYVRLSPLDLECAVFVAPEVKRGQPPTEKADVYSFGVVLVELDTGESPEFNRKRRLSLQDSPEMNSPTAQHTGFALSPNCSSMMKALITACVERDPARRPSMAEISMALRTSEMKL